VPRAANLPPVVAVEHVGGTIEIVISNRRWVKAVQHVNAIANGRIAVAASECSTISRSDTGCATLLSVLPKQSAALLLG
jgi:hypothetical protein